MKVDVAVLAVPNSPYGFCGRKAAMNFKLPSWSINGTHQITVARTETISKKGCASAANPIARRRYGRR